MNPFTPEEMREAQLLGHGERTCACGAVITVRTHGGGEPQSSRCLRCRKREEKRRLYAQRKQHGLTARGQPLKGGNGTWY
jgi:hypothetical protein